MAPISLGSRGLLGETGDLRLLVRLLSRFALPLIVKNVVDVFIVILIIRCFAGVKKNLDLLLHLIAGDAVRVEELVEVGDNKALDMEVGPSPPILDALDCSGNTTQYPHLVPSEIKFLALEVCHLQTQSLD